MSDILQRPYPGTVLRWMAEQYKRSRRLQRVMFWAHVVDVFALGSTSSIRICREYGLDPETGRNLKAQDQE